MKHGALLLLATLAANGLSIGVPSHRRYWFAWPPCGLVSGYSIAHVWPYSVPDGLQKGWCPRHSRVPAQGCSAAVGQADVPHRPLIVVCRLGSPWYGTTRHKWVKSAGCS